MARRRKNGDDPYGINPQPGLFIASAAGAVAGSAVIAAIVANKVGALGKKPLKDKIQKVIDAWNSASSEEKHEVSANWGVLASLVHVNIGEDEGENFPNFLKTIRTQNEENKALQVKNKKLTEMNSILESRFRIHKWEIDDIKKAHKDDSEFDNRIKKYKETPEWKNLSDERTDIEEND